MYDIRLLTLFKQHYRDVYDATLSCDYSCWGYFDGLDIMHPDALPCSTPFSALWQANGSKVAEQKGDFSSQNIGLLRYLADEADQADTAAFWMTNSRMPFFAVLLLQLKNEAEYATAARLLEQEGCWAIDDPVQKSYCRTIAYCTFDNTDLVLLIHGNSLDQMQKALRRIETLPAVRYVHSIFGVAEAYLKVCQKAGTIQDMFQGTVCCLDEYVPELQINVVTDGSPDVKGILRSQLEAWAKRSSCLRSAAISGKNGHETFTISLYNVRVTDMLRLFVPGAFGTHQNPLYGKNVYNISTSLLFDRRHLYKIQPHQPPAPPLPPELPTKLWCRQLMDEYREKLSDAQRNKDESLCSYYQAMFQTLNTLSQYEQFALSEGIFLSLIPPLLMLNEQFSNALLSPNVEQLQGKLRESLCLFLEYANMVIYHTIHTDQIFLMVPGYSGTAFSIPIKLNLLFLWLSRKLTQILNDSDHKYECILTPVMESKPITHLIEFNTMDQDRLIAIKVSQRLLYKPQELTVILSHEIAHYVGKTLRCRSFRLEQLSELLAYYVAMRLLPEELWPDTLPPNQFDACKRWVVILSTSLQRYLKQHVKAFQDSEPYAEACVKQLAMACRFWLVAQTNRLESLVLRVPKELEDELLRDRSTYVTQMKFLTRIQNHIQENWKTLLRTMDCEEVIEEMFTISREVFSDMVALAVLECSKEDFYEAFSASEGVPIDDSNCPVTQCFRQDIADRVVYGNPRLEFDYNLVEHSAREGLYQYYGIKEYLEEYARACYKQIQQRLVKPNIQPIVKEIRDFYHLISQGENGAQLDVYAKISQYIGEYGLDVRKLLAGTSGRCTTDSTL